MTPLIPTAELHMHVEGAIEPELLVTIARRNAIPLPTYDADALRQRYTFHNLQSFLDLHYANLAVMQTEQDFHDLGALYLDAARRAGVRRAESFVDAMVHTRRGVPLAAVMNGYAAAFDEARRDGFSCDLILGITRDMGVDAAHDLLDAAAPFRESFIGIGLDSTEVGYPPSLFASVYRRAAADGLHLVAHAGEEGGPEYVREALDDLHVQRIDHGLRALEDADLMARLVDEQIALTVCPLSNVALRAVDRMEEHPVFEMLELGALVTVSTDDPAYFGGQIDANFAALAAAGATGSQLRRLARNSFEAAFIPPGERRRHLQELDDTVFATP